MKLYAFSADDIYDYLDKQLEYHSFNGKCGYCNWEVEKFYVLANSSEEALETIMQMVKDDGNPLCGQCMSDMLSSEGYTIIPKNNS